MLGDLATRCLGCFLFLFAAFAVTVGCQAPKKFDTSVPVVEEFNVPPDESRYNDPPESGYKKPPPKKEVSAKQGIGPAGPGSGGVGGPGMGQGMGGMSGGSPGMGGMGGPR